MTTQDDWVSKKELDDATLSPLQMRVLCNGRCPMCHTKGIERTATTDGNFTMVTNICHSCESIFIM